MTNIITRFTFGKALSLLLLCLLLSAAAPTVHAQGTKAAGADSAGGSTTSTTTGSTYTKAAGADSAGGSTTSTTAGADVSNIDPDCRPPDGKGYKAIVDSMKTNEAKEAAAYGGAYNDATQTAAANLGKKPLGDVRDTLCLRKFEKYMNLVKMLLGSMAAVLNMLLDWINQLLNVACQYVVAMINNALNSVCIPLPNLGSLPGFGGPDRKTCNGISLANIMQFGVNPPYVPTFSTSGMEKYYNEKIANTPASRGVRDQSTRDTATKQ